VICFAAALDMAKSIINVKRQGVLLPARNLSGLRIADDRMGQIRVWAKAHKFILSRPSAAWSSSELK
jgi:hypothetical protein